MHVSGGNGTRAPRGPSAFVALVVLLVVVALASTGQAPVGSGGARRPSEQLIDTLVSLVLVLLVVGTVAILYLWYTNRHMLVEERLRRRQGKSRHRLLIALGVIAVLLIVIVRVQSTHRRDGDRAPGRAAIAVRRAGMQGPTRQHYEPRFATIPVLIVLGIAGAGLLAALLASRARPVSPDAPEPSLALLLADVLAETLDDIRAEPDPRKAVIAAYARLERTLAAFGLPRRDSEAPAEYLHRILGDLEVGSRPATRLTELFTSAKFSTHPMGNNKKEEAIELLTAIRADLTAAEAAAAREQGRRRELPSAWGQTG
jgi:Domain of unknown function (DUF4129)